MPAVDSAAQILAPASYSAERIVAEVVHQSRQLDTSTCPLSIRFHETSFPYLSKTINGTAYFGKAARFAAVFTNVPAVLRGFPAAYTAMMNVGRWHDGFEMSLDAPELLGDHSDIVLHLASRDPSSTLHYGRAFINPASWRIEAMDWHFTDMEFSITQSFVQLGSFVVLAGQKATIHVPIARAEATATFGHYQQNAAISPAIFADM